MPKRKVTAEEEIANLNRRASENEIRIGRRRIIFAMDQAPSCIPHLISKLESCGYSDARLKTKEDRPESFQTKAVEARKALKSEGGGSGGGGPGGSKDESDGEDHGDMVPKKYWRLESMSRASLRDRLVVELDHRVLSIANLKNSIDKLGAAAAKVVYLEILQGCCGFTPDMAITGKYRYWSCLVDDMKQRAAARGNRARSLELPPSWEGFLYSILGEDEQRTNVLVKHNFTHRTVQVQSSRLPEHDDLQQLYIHQGFSERLAAIASTKTGDSHESDYLLKNHFPDQELDAADLAGAASRGSASTSSSGRAGVASRDSAEVSGSRPRSGGSSAKQEPTTPVKADPTTPVEPEEDKIPKKEEVPEFPKKEQEEVKIPNKEETVDTRMLTPTKAEGKKEEEEDVCHPETPEQYKKMLMSKLELEGDDEVPDDLGVKSGGGSGLAEPVGVVYDDYEEVPPPPPPPLSEA